MRETEDDKRNKRLAEWLGWKVVTEDTPTGLPEMWLQRGIEIYTSLGWVDFTRSLDACFKHLKPVVIARGEGAILTWRKVLSDWLKIMAEEKAMDNAPALALCTAIEKQFGLVGGS